MAVLTSANPRKPMQQQTNFLEVLLQSKPRRTRHEVYLSLMEKAIPWALLVQLIEPFYPTGKRGRTLIGIVRMLRLYFVQLWYNFSAHAVPQSSGSAKLRQRPCQYLF